MKRHGLALQPGRAAAPGRARQADFGIKVEDQGQIRLKVADDLSLQRRNQIRRGAAGGPLIGAGGIGEPVADDPGAAFQGGCNRALQVVGAGGVHQKRFGAGGPAVGAALNHQIADRFGAGGAARLARQNDLKAQAGQGNAQGLSLSGLAGPLPAFECDEPAASHRACIALRSGSGKGLVGFAVDLVRRQQVGVGKPGRSDAI